MNLQAGATYQAVLSERAPHRPDRVMQENCPRKRDAEKSRLATRVLQCMARHDKATLMGLPPCPTTVAPDTVFSGRTNPVSNESSSSAAWMPGSCMRSWIVTTVSPMTPGEIVDSYREGETHLSVPTGAPHLGDTLSAIGMDASARSLTVQKYRRTVSCWRASKRTGTSIDLLNAMWLSVFGVTWQAPPDYYHYWIAVATPR